MPKRTAKPTIRIDKRGDVWRITIYKVANRVRIRHATVVVKGGDRAELLAALTPIYARLRAKPATQEK